MIKNRIKRELPCEKYERLGPEALSDAELLAILIRTGTKGEDGLTVAEKIIGNHEEGILLLQSVTIEELMQIKGIGRVKAVRIKCIGEFSRRMAMQSRVKSLNFNRPSTIAAYYMEQLRHLETEHVYLILTDNKNCLLREILISKGTVNASLLSTREVFAEALKYQAVHIFLLHNHPSGDPGPSEQDIRITEQILEASRILNVPLLDHIIIGDNKYISLKEKGYL